MREAYVRAEREAEARAPEGLDLLPIELRQPGHAQKHQRDSLVGHNVGSGALTFTWVFSLISFQSEVPGSVI